MTKSIENQEKKHQIDKPTMKRSITSEIIREIIQKIPEGLNIQLTTEELATLQEIAKSIPKTVTSRKAITAWCSETVEKIIQHNKENLNSERAGTIRAYVINMLNYHRYKNEFDATLLPIVNSGKKVWSMKQLSSRTASFHSYIYKLFQDSSGEFDLNFLWSQPRTEASFRLSSVWQKGLFLEANYQIEH